ncbi:MAG: type IV toxin-antitoxin system AbiEi family antitoxin [Vicinamibacterales bacterium]
MRSLDAFLDDQLSRGRAYFEKPDAMAATGQSSTAFTAAASRLLRKHRLLSPKRSFYLIIRPEDRAAGAPDPARWIDPLMRHVDVDYRVSLLRAAAFHGSSHQAALVFQVIVPKQMRPIVAGRQRIQFIYQAPDAFARTNREAWLGQLKTDAGFAKVAGIELVLLDAARYFHQAAGLNGAAQIVHDLGGNADPRQLAKAAAFYENSTARRLGYLLEHFGHRRQATALRPFGRAAKSTKMLDPSVKRIAALGAAAKAATEAPHWKLILNASIEIDA